MTAMPAVDVVPVSDAPLALPGASRATVRFAVGGRTPAPARIRARIVSPVPSGEPPPSRVAEFVAGRYCAERAIAALLGRREPVGRAADHAPRWPTGLVGSITHCEDVAAAAVIRTGRVAGLGIDVEALMAPAVAEAMHARITSEAERERLDGSALDPVRLATLVFSAKESVFKCVQPLTGAAVGLREIRIERLDAGRRTFAASLAGTAVERVEALGRFVLRGSFAVTGGLLHTAVWATPSVTADARRHFQERTS